MMFSNITKRIQKFNAARELNSIKNILNRESSGLFSDELVELIFSERWKRFFWIKQIKSEILSLCRLIQERRPKVILEIGTANGGSLFLFTKLAHPKATIISIDLPSGRFGGGYPNYRVEFYKSFCLQDQRMHLIRDDSHNHSVYEKVADIIGEQKIDFLFIDGDHTYEGVKKDFEMYSSLISTKGLIALHDVAIHNQASACKVHKYWSELKSLKLRTQELIEDQNQGWAGIGIVFND